MDFFDPPQVPDDPSMYGPDIHAMPEWICAPSNVLSVLVPVDLVLGRSPGAVVQLSGIRVYPNSWDATLVIKRKPGPGSHMWDDPMDFHPMMMHPGMYPPGMTPPDVEAMLRYGFQYSDGTKITSTGNGPGFGDPEDDMMAEPKNPIMHPAGGGGGGPEGMSIDMHIWPLPAPGEVSVVCEWKSAGIEQTITTVDGNLVVEAAARVEKLWDLPEGPEGGGGQTQVRIY